jgi:hypothetical protein
MKIRLRQYSIAAEMAYTCWIKRFVHFHNIKRSKDLGASVMRAFLSHQLRMGMSSYAPRIRTSTPSSS